MFRHENGVLVALSPEQAAIEAALTEPAAPSLPRVATALKLRYALNQVGQRAAWDAAVAMQSQATRDYWETEPNPPETSPKLKRIANAAGVSLSTLYDLALTL